MGQSMEIAQLRYFLSASESDNFTLAAKRCFTSRQNLTRSIHNLEDELSVTLFTRMGNRTMLTREGENAVEHARIIVDEAKILEDSFKTGASREPLSVILGTNSDMFLPKRAFDREFALDFTVSEYASESCYRQIVEGKNDVAFVWCMDQDFIGCSSVLIRRDHVFYLVSQDSDLAKKNTLRVEDLAGHDICMMSDPSFTYTSFLARFQKLGMDKTCLRQINSVPFMKNEIRRKDAVAFGMVDFCVNPLPGIVAVSCAEPEMDACVYALYQRGSVHISSALKLITRIRKICNEVYGVEN